MKRIATLLFIYLSLATAMPAFAQIEAGCDSVCTSEEKKETSNNHCPFATCCCTICTVCYHQEEKLKFVTVQTGTEKIKVENVNATSAFTNECWHPPEMI